MVDDKERDRAGRPPRRRSTPARTGICKDKIEGGSQVVEAVTVGQPRGRSVPYFGFPGRVSESRRRAGIAASTRFIVDPARRDSAISGPSLRRVRQASSPGLVSRVRVFRRGNAVPASFVARRRQVRWRQTSPSRVYLIALGRGLERRCRFATPPPSLAGQGTTRPIRPARTTIVRRGTHSGSRSPAAAGRGSGGEAETW